DPEEIHRLVETRTLLDVIADRRDHRQKVLDGLSLLLCVRELSAFDRGIQSELQKRRRAAAESAVCSFAVLSYEVVRVLSVGQHEYLYVKIVREKQFDRPASGLYAGGIAVVIDHNAPRESRKQLCLRIRKRRPEARNDVINAILNKRDEVEIAFDEDHKSFAANGVLRLKKPVKVVALGVGSGLGRIEILRVVVRFDRPCAERDGFARDIQNREHHAAAKTVKKPFFLFVYADEAGLGDQLIIRTEIPQKPKKRLPFVG